jgi:4'-phosphopantetheinyl transferase
VRPSSAGSDVRALNAGEIHIIPARLERSADELAELNALLSANELERASQLKFEDARRRFIAGRGLLRRVLGEYTRRSPAELIFNYGQRGKPALEGEHWLHFNLSHSHELAVIAVSAGQEVGVDIERLRPAERMESLAWRYFAEEEANALLALPEDQRVGAFFAIWTRKEAYLKALGRGFSIPLRSFAVTLDQPARLLRGEGADQWQLWHLEPAAGYVGALAAQKLVNESMIIYQEIL